MRGRRALGSRGPDASVSRGGRRDLGRRPHPSPASAATSRCDCPAAARAAIELDHLVVACRTLDAGRAWCEATFGVEPAPGGKHALMGTHNLLLSVTSPRFPRAYLELIAIDPDASPPSRPRWFDLDDPDMQAHLAAAPTLVHWVARTADS